MKPPRICVMKKVSAQKRGLLPLIAQSNARTIMFAGGNVQNAPFQTMWDDASFPSHKSIICTKLLPDLLLDGVEHGQVGVDEGDQNGGGGDVYVNGLLV